MSSFFLFGKMKPLGCMVQTLIRPAFATQHSAFERTWDKTQRASFDGRVLCWNRPVASRTKKNTHTHLNLKGPN